VNTFFAPTRRFTVCNAGHPRPLIYRAAQRQWDFLHSDDHPNPKAGPRNLPLGILSISDYDQFDIELEVGDCVMSYTDALIESQDADGQMLGESGLLRIMQLLGDVEPSEFIGVLLREIRDRYPENLSQDDVTVMLVRVNSRKPHYSLRERLKALMRFAGSMVRAINPRSERPPIPDFHMANVGGAIIPALNRFWRVRRVSMR
jgi:hypothetical protein